MSNRVIKDTIHTSDKLAACTDPSVFTLPLGDLAKLLYSYVAILQQDDWGCFEINPRVLCRCFTDFVQPIKLDTMLAVLGQWNHNGLLFVWSQVPDPSTQQEKLWGYLTGKEPGRLPEPTRRHLRKTPIPVKPDTKRKPLGFPQTCEWSPVVEYLQNYNSIQPATEGLLDGFKVVRTASASLQPPTNNPQQPTKHLQRPTKRLQSPTIARAGARPDLNPDLNPEPRTVQNRDRSQERRTVLSSSVKKTLRDLRKSMEANAGKNGDLRKQLEKSIYRNRLFANYDDLFNAARKKEKKPQELLSDFESLMQEWVDDCVNLLLAERGAVELKGIVPHFLVNKALEKIKPSLQILFGLKDYKTRKRQAGGRLINCVVDAALELRK